MCGLIGATAQMHGLEADRLELGIAKLRHRGPDDEGLERLEVGSSTVLLGHTRLAIIDLTQSGHQPIRSSDGRFVMIFNGEIYNYRELRGVLSSAGHVFTSRSDTEVLLASWSEWGVDCLRRLHGMFAFVVVDRAAATLTGVRDAFGIKPLYYRVDDGAFQFASEVPALLELSRRRPTLNVGRALDYLVRGVYDYSNETFLDGVLQLPPGHLISVDLRRQRDPQLSKWWSPTIEERAGLSFSDAAEEVRELFLTSVKLNLRSDVPLGAALSGGVDSSAIVCAMRHLEPDMPIHTFSFVGAGPADEESWADAVNAHVGAIPHKVSVRPGELAKDIDDVIRCQGEPFGSTSIYAQYRVYELARREGVTVTLDGQGADEMFAGYHGYPGSRLRSLVDAGRPAEMVSLMRAWSRWPGRSYRDAVSGLVAESMSQARRKAINRSLGRDRIPPWLAVGREQWSARDELLAVEPSTDARGRRLSSALRGALSGQGLSALLRHGDRNSMRWSVESRVPFLANEIAHCALTLPEQYLLAPNGETKSVFRAAMRGIVPAEILDRKDKIGFVTPEASWLRPLKSEIDEWMSAASGLPFLRGEVCRAYVDDAVHGRQPLGTAWRLINYCRWVQLVGAEVG